MTLQTHEFTLVLLGVPELTPDVLNSLFDSGCDDALIGMRDGVAFADFSRDGPSLDEAVRSAIRDVGNAGITARIEKHEPGHDG